MCAIQLQRAGRVLFLQLVPTYFGSHPKGANIPAGGRGGGMHRVPARGALGRGQMERKAAPEEGAPSKQPSSISFILKRAEGTGDGVSRLQIKHSPLRPTGQPATRTLAGS